MKKITLAVSVFLLLGALPAMASAQNNELPPGQLVKAHSSDTVYYIDSDLRRYVFPNARIFNSWYENFGDVVEVSDDEISDYQLGGNVLYKPGKRLVKLLTDPKVYAVDDGGTLRWVKSEKAARAIYGDDWNQFVDDLSDAFFANYTIGDDIDGPENFDKHLHKRIKKISQTLEKLRKKLNRLRSDYLAYHDDNAGHGKHKVAVCHNFGENHPHTIFISKNALKAHLKHGDTAGRCDSDTQDDDDNDGDDSDDTTAPIFGDIVISGVTRTEATLSWTTDEATSYTLYYATTSPVDTATAEFFGSGVLTESWGATLSNLVPGTTYYAVIVAADEAGNEITSREQSFTTDAIPDETAPVVSEITASGVTRTQATVSWTTDEATTYTLYYEATTPVDLETAESMTSEALAESNEVTFTFLLPETTYYVVVVATDAAGNETTTEEFSFTTETEVVVDETAPVLSDIVTSDVTDTGATLSWTTDEETTYVAYYSTETPVDTEIADSAADDVLAESGEETLTELLPETTYYVVIVAADEAGNEATSAEQSFTTEAEVVIDETAPVLSDIVTSGVTTTEATLSWTTDEATSYTLYYATTSPVDLETADSVNSDVLSESGEVTLTDLLSETDYFVVIVATDEAGNEATSTEQSFTTEAVE